MHDVTHQVYYERLQQLRWPNMDHDPAFKRLKQMKREFLDGDDTQTLVREQDIREEYERKIQQKQTEIRDRIITSAYENTELKYSDIGQTLPDDMRLSGQRVGQIVREENA